MAQATASRIIFHDIKIDYASEYGPALKRFLDEHQFCSVDHVVFFNTMAHVEFMSGEWIQVSYGMLKGYMPKRIIFREI